MAVVVGDAGDFEGEDFFEDAVHGGEEAGVGAEVVGEVDEFGFLLAGDFFGGEEEFGFRRGGSCKWIVLHRRRRRGCRAPSKRWGEPRGCGGGSLKRVDVLEFVDEEVVVAGAEGFGGAVARVGEEVEGEAFEVGEVEAVLVALEGGVVFFDFVDEGEEGFRGGRRAAGDGRGDRRGEKRELVADETGELVLLRSFHVAALRRFEVAERGNLWGWREASGADRRRGIGGRCREQA